MDKAALYKIMASVRRELVRRSIPAMEIFLFNKARGLLLHQRQDEITENNVAYEDDFLTAPHQTKFINIKSFSHYLNEDTATQIPYIDLITGREISSTI